MAVVIEDIVQGNGARLTIRGWEFDRIFNVSQLTDVGSAKLVEAVEATNIPFGQPHPAINSAFAIEFIPESLESADAARVTIRYKEYSQDYLVEIGSRTLSKQTNKSFFDPNASDGNPTVMELTYKYPDDYELNDKVVGKEISQGVKVSVQNYFPTIVITRTEFETTAADVANGYPAGAKLTGQMLTDRAKVYNGKINKANWNIRPSDPEHVWRLEMSAASAEDGLAYRVRYAFAYDPDKWSFLAVFNDPYSGEPVPDPANPLPSNPEAASEADYPMYLAENFTLLGLV
jgi:hypothetical protein